MARVPDNAATIGRIQRFEAYSGRSSVLKSCDLTLKCVAAGIRWRGTLRDMRGKPHLPPTEEAVFFWSAYFPAGRTSQQYPPHLGKSCLLLGCDPNCQTKAVAKAARGLAKAGDKARAPKPAVAQRLFGKILLSSGLADEFTEALWASWSFSLRVQSE